MKRLLIVCVVVCVVAGCAAIDHYRPDIDKPQFSSRIKSQIQKRVDEKIKVGRTDAAVKGALVNVELLGVQVSDAVKVIFGDVLRVPYVMQGGVADQSNRVDISIKRKISKSEMVKVVRRMLNLAGVQVQEREGVYYLSLLKENELIEPEEKKVVRVIALEKADVDQVVGVLNGIVKPSMGVEFYGEKTSGCIVYTALDTETKKIDGIIQSLDVEAPQVFCEVVILEYIREGALMNGLYAYLSKNIDNFATAFTFGAKDFVKGLAQVSVVKDAGELSSIFGILETEGIVQNVASPFLVMLSGHESSLSMGDEIPTLGKTSISDGLSNQDIVYKSTGVSLIIKPKVINDLIYFDIDISTSSGEVNQLSNIQSPTISKRQIKTAFKVSPGQSILIGGITKEKSMLNTSGFPYFIKFWKNYIDQNERVRQKTELLLYLRPYIIDENEDYLNDRLEKMGA